jgi:hypothetical protein
MMTGAAKARDLFERHVLNPAQWPFELLVLLKTFRPLLSRSLRDHRQSKMLTG